METTKQHTATEPAVYVGTYAKYNAGSLEGDWLQLTDYYSHEEFLEACHELHGDEADPELMFQDFEGFPKVFWSESHISPILWDWIELSEELSAEQMEAFELFATNGGYELEQMNDAREAFQEAYRGYWGENSGVFTNPRHEFAYHLAEDMGVIKRMEEMGIGGYYFDVKAYARDLFINDYWEEGGHVFRYV